MSEDLWVGLQTDHTHAFAAVLTYDVEAQPNARYLQRNLHREVREHVAGMGDAAAALPAAFAALDRAYRNLHPFNGPVLAGVRVAAAYVDLRAHALHLCVSPPPACCTHASFKKWPVYTLGGSLCSIPACLPGCTDLNPDFHVHVVCATTATPAFFNKQGVVPEGAAKVLRQSFADSACASNPWLTSACGVCCRAANIGCRGIAGRAAPGGDVRVVAELGRGSAPGVAAQAEKQGGAEAGDAASVAVSSVALSKAVDTIVVASEGVWYASRFRSAEQLASVKL